MTSLPPEDKPPLPSFVMTSDEEAVAEIGSPGPDNPITVGAAFLTALDDPQLSDREILALLCTPESALDLDEVRDLLQGCGMLSRAPRAIGDERVAYVRYLTSPETSMKNIGEDTIIGVRAIATLVWRPELRMWRLHAVGDYVHPDEVPHGPARQ